jgi:hypothetical protein
MPEWIEASPDFLRQVCFSGEATFHIIGVVNRYNCRICWGSQYPHVTSVLERGSPKVNVWAGFMHGKLMRHFYFRKKLWPHVRTWTCWRYMRCPDYHLKLSSYLPIDDWEMGRQRRTNFFLPISPDLTPLDFHSGVMCRRLSTRLRSTIFNTWKLA